MTQLFNGFRLSALTIGLAAAAIVAGCGGGDNEAAQSQSDAATPNATAQSTTVRESTAAKITAAAPQVSSQTRRRNLPSATAPGTGVFVDAVNGSDSNVGTLAAPWKTLAKVASSAHLKAGDGVWLACGSVWREALSLGTTQLVTGSIISGYGSTCATTPATISGADLFSGGWTKSGNIWSKPVPTTEPKVLRMFINGTSQRPAQWPNYGGVGKEYALADASSPSSSTNLVVNTTDAATLAGKNLVGATMQVRVGPWYINQSTVASYNATTRTLTTTAATTYPMAAGQGYVLQGQQWMLDAPGEFFHDTVKGMLYVYPADAASQSNLNASVVEGSVRDNALTVASASSVAISNLAITMARTDGLLLNYAPSASVSGILASHNGRSGIRVSLTAAPPNGARGATIQNNTVSDNWVDGIDSSGGINVSILSNTVSNTGTIGNAGPTTAGILGGIGSIIDRNNIAGTGYHGIQFSGTGGTQITNNVIQSYCLRLTDCAGIYAWNAATITSQVTANQLSNVANNRVLAATPDTQGAVGGGFNIVAGIYLDNLMMNVTVQNNMLTGMPIGLLVHNSSHNVIEGNSVWFTTSTGLWADMDGSAGGDYMSSNTFHGNQFVPATTVSGTWPALPTLGSSYAISFQDQISGTASMTSGSNSFTGNQIVQLNGVASAVAYVLTSAGQQQLTASGWQALNPGEAPLWAPATYAAYSTTEGPELVNGGDFSAGITPWTSWFWSGATGGSVQLASGTAGCTGNCAKFHPASIYDLLYSPGFTMTPNLPYVLRFNAAFGGPGTIGRPGIGTNTNPSNSVLGTQGYVTLNSLTGNTGDVINFQGIFVPNSSAQSRVNLSLATPGVPVTFDSISVKQVLGYTWSQASQWSAIVFAPTDTPKTVGCSDLGWGSTCSVMDVNGNSIAMPATLSGGSNKLLLRVDSPWKM